MVKDEKLWLEDSGAKHTLMDKGVEGVTRRGP